MRSMTGINLQEVSLEKTKTRLFQILGHFEYKKMKRMEPKEKKAFEPTGLVPRSIVRTFERFRQQLLPGSERAAIREYRISRYQVLVSARCLFALLTIPIATNWFVSSWLLSPIIEHYWNTQQNEIFLNSYQEERAFAELEFFSNKLFFESLLSNQNDFKNPKGYQAEKPFNIEIAKRRSFPEDNQRIFFLKNEETRRPFGVSPYTPPCWENTLVKTVGRDRIGIQQDVSKMFSSRIPDLSAVSLPNGDYIFDFAPAFVQARVKSPMLSASPVQASAYSPEVWADPPLHLLPSSMVTFAPKVHRASKIEEGALCTVGMRGVSATLAPKVHVHPFLSREMNRRGCQEQTTDAKPFQSLQPSQPNFNSITLTTGVHRWSRCTEGAKKMEEKDANTNGGLSSATFPQPSWQYSDIENSKDSLRLPPHVGLFVGFNSNASVVCHRKELVSAAKRRNQSPISIFNATAISELNSFELTIPPYFQLDREKVTSYASLHSPILFGGNLPLVKVVESKAITPIKPNSVNEPIERAKSLHSCKAIIASNSNSLLACNTCNIEDVTSEEKVKLCGVELLAICEFEFTCCTNGVAFIGDFSSQNGCRKQTPEVGDLMRRLELNKAIRGLDQRSVGALNLEKVQTLKERETNLVDRQLYYSVPLSSINSIDQFMDIWNTNNTENSAKIKERIQEKIVELAVYYNEQTILSITNIAGDFISVLTLGCLFIWMKPEISILKSFLIEAIYSLSDTTKSFLLILLTDLLVGFHSPRGWETALELLLKHFGLPENQDFVFLFVATFPVLLDTVFKYWIFRHLNKISPSTVATYHSMIE